MKKVNRLSKAYGLKSSIVVNDEVIFTSFGRGNDSILESKLDTDKKINKISKEPKFDVKYNSCDESLNLIHKMKQIQINNPLNNGKVGMDYLEAKPILEKEYFNKEFNDNIHIQIAYNLLDIKKILSLYFYNIVYSFNNLQRKPIDENKENDLIGSFLPDYDFYNKNEKQEKLFATFKQKITPYFEFYGTIFKYDKKNPDKYDEHNYNVLRLLAYSRNFLAHDQSDLYNLDAKMEKTPEIKHLLNNIFENDYKDINKDFNNNAKKNLDAIFKILSIYPEDKRTVNQVFEQYYNFAIFKECKNIGINIKKLREAIYALNRFSGDIMDHRHDTYRTKINTVMDFLIYKFVHIDNPSLELEMVNSLRKTLTDEAKEQCYLDYAKHIFFKMIKENRDITNIAFIVKKVAIANIKTINLDFQEQIRNISKIDRVSTFTKFIYFISKFLEPKEINELYSSLINKLDNVCGLIDVANKVLSAPVKFSNAYIMFNENVNKFASELRICRSISKMNPELKNIKKQLYKDALAILNVKDDVFENSDALDETLEEILNKDKGDKQLRNFIVNNVIKSKRFNIVIKYMNPRQCIKFVKSDVILNYVLSNLPESQIDRYHKSVFGDYSCDTKTKINQLRKKIKSFSFEDIKKQENVIIDASKQRNKKPVEFEKLKALVGLYLTIIYLIVKSLVKINSVHIIAMECYERDYYMFNSCDAKNKHLMGKETLSLLNRMIELNKYNKHAMKYLKENISYYEQLLQNEVFKHYRNRILHLNFVNNSYKYLGLRKMDSYYDLYQYIVQSDLIEFIKKSKNSNSLIEIYKSDILEFDFYSKDMTKIINLPLAYNLARYKNLTIGDLYNDKYKRNSKEE